MKKKKETSGKLDFGSGWTFVSWNQSWFWVLPLTPDWASSRYFVRPPSILVFNAEPPMSKEAPTSKILEVFSVRC